jgi:hypothetical protein
MRLGFHSLEVAGIRTAQLPDPAASGSAYDHPSDALIFWADSGSGSREANMAW